MYNFEQRFFFIIQGYLISKLQTVRIAAIEGYVRGVFELEPDHRQRCGHHRLIRPLLGIHAQANRA